MKKAIPGVFLILAGLVAFFIGQEVFVRAVGLGFAVTGVLMVIVAAIEGDGK